MFIGNLLIYKHGGIRNGKSSSSLESLVDKYYYRSACRCWERVPGSGPLPGQARGVRKDLAETTFGQILEINGFKRL